MTPQRPRRQRLGDRLTSSGASPVEVACDHAVAPFDRAARDMDRKWGIGRLPELVAPETAARYGGALGKFNDMLDAGDPAEIAKWAGVCIRGLAAMDAEAEAANQPKAHPAVIVMDVDGFRMGILTDDDYWPAVAAMHPDLRLYTSRQIANLARAQFENPGYPVERKPKRAAPVDQSLDDPIPF